MHKQQFVENGFAKYKKKVAPQKMNCPNLYCPYKLGQFTLGRRLFLFINCIRSDVCVFSVGFFLTVVCGGIHCMKKLIFLWSDSEMLFKFMDKVA